MVPLLLVVPLRQRKKALVRQAILASAEKLFEARGFDQVTVADIADDANVSVKTLFTYFRSKDDLVFQDTQLLDALLAGVASRSRKTTPAQAVAAVLVRAVEERADVVASLDGYQRGYAESDTLRARILRLWAEYEDRFAAALASEADLPAPTAEVRFHAAQLVTLVRSATWRETRDLAASSSAGVRRGAAERLVTWLEVAAETIDRGRGGKKPRRAKR